MIMVVRQEHNNREVLGQVCRRNVPKKQTVVLFKKTFLLSFYLVALSNLCKVTSDRMKACCVDLREVCHPLCQPNLWANQLLPFEPAALAKRRL